MADSEKILLHGDMWFTKNRFPVVVGKVFAVQDDRKAEPDDFTGVPHMHDCPELVFVQSGSALHHMEGEDYPISAGDVFCILGEQEHYYHEMDKLQITNLMYDPARLLLPQNHFRKIPGYNAMFTLEPSYRKEHKFSSRLSLYPHELARANHLLDQIDDELKKREPGYEACVLANLTRLIVFLSRHYGDHPGKEAVALLRIGKIIGSIEEAPYKDWSLKNLADEASLSVNSLIRVFNQATGMPPIEYLIRLRTRHAMELLANSTMSITDIALEVGFNDSNYFARQFRRINGISATEYRKHHGR
jgi:AraC-like DNA-binding protein